LSADSLVGVSKEVIEYHLHTSQLPYSQGYTVSTLYLMPLHPWIQTNSMENIQKKIIASGLNMNRLFVVIPKQYSIITIYI
jgi:hypothetical protein